MKSGYTIYMEIHQLKCLIQESECAVGCTTTCGELTRTKLETVKKQLAFASREVYEGAAAPGIDTLDVVARYILSPDASRAIPKLAENTTLTGLKAQAHELIENLALNSMHSNAALLHLVAIVSAIHLQTKGVHNRGDR